MQLIMNDRKFVLNRINEIAQHTLSNMILDDSRKNPSVCQENLRLLIEKLKIIKSLSNSNS